MKDLYKKALEAYLKMLEIHIDTKTIDAWFHKANEKFYETLFEVAHKIWEKSVDLWWKLNDLSLEEKKKESNNIIKSLREEIEKYKDENELTLWTEDLLWSLCNSLEDIEWTSRAFVK